MDLRCTRSLALGRRSAAVVALAGLALAAGCGSSGSNGAAGNAPTTTAVSSTTAAAGSEFCAINIAIDKATANASTEAGIVDAFRAHQADILRFESVAPPSLRKDARSLVAAAKLTIARRSVAGIETPALDAASARVDSYCGVNADGTPAG